MWPFNYKAYELDDFEKNMFYEHQRKKHFKYHENTVILLTYVGGAPQTLLMGGI